MRSQKMVALDRETSNRLFEVFEDWDHQLKQIDPAYLEEIDLPPIEEPQP